MIKIYCNKNLKNTLAENNVSEYLPAYKGESAGLDLYNVGEDVTIVPATCNHKGSMISTGLHIFTPPGYVSLIKERGSIIKTPLKYRAGVIDKGYTGEVFVNLVNISDDSFTIKKNQKLPVQIVVIKCDNEYLKIEEDEYIRLSQNTLRQEGKIGSTD